MAAVPQLSLPIRVTVILHEERSKSTGLHAQVLAPDHVKLYDVRCGGASAMPSFDPATTAVAFPSADACTFAELADANDIGSIRTLVVLCCPWQQYHKLVALPQLAGVRHVRIANVPEQSDFWRVPVQDAGHMSTIEALALLLEEYKSAAAQSGVSIVESPARSPLLFFFDLIRAKIARVGGSARSLPWEGAAREKRRGQLEQPDRIKFRSVGRLREYHSYGAASSHATDDAGSASDAHPPSLAPSAGDLVRQTKSADPDDVPSGTPSTSAPYLRGIASADVDAYFVSQLGQPDRAFDAMLTMSVGDLEKLQGLADEVHADGLDEAARGIGLEWSTRIGSFIA